MLNYVSKFWGSVWKHMFGKYLHALNVAQAAGLFRSKSWRTSNCFCMCTGAVQKLVLIYQNKVPDICSYLFSISFFPFEPIKGATLKASRTCQHCFVVLTCWGCRQEWRRCWRKGGRILKNGNRRASWREVWGEKWCSNPSPTPWRFMDVCGRWSMKVLGGSSTSSLYRGM